MSQIFRLGTSGSNTLQDWQNVSVFPYDKTNIDTITDPNGASASREITSIPSPFARIDLVKSAFGIVANSKDKNGNPDLDGNTIYHKMVSDALDVGEIFFNIGKYKDLIDIITWDIRKETDSLIHSQDIGHHDLGLSLKTYFERDKGYNFAQTQNIYLLNFKKGPAPLNIIGATSPATLFFSNANDLSYVGQYITFGQDKPFDNEYQPLYKRDFEYVKAWFYFMNDPNVMPNFAQDFPEVYDYLQKTYTFIKDQNQKQELLAPQNYIQDSTVLSITPTTNVEVLGTNLLQKNITYKSGTSDFEIDATVNSNQILPLVLPVESGNTYSQLKYNTDQWGKDNKAPYIDENSLTDRILPEDGSTFPYLTISDFLEDTIIGVQHTINQNRFFAQDFSNPNQNEFLTYLLPIKDTFFDYFSAKDLMSPLKNGKPMIEMEKLAAESVKVILRIPIKAKGNNKIDFIEYSRIYYGGNNTPDIENNSGAVAIIDFTGYVMPQVEFDVPADAHYNIGCICTPMKKYKFSFYRENKLIAVESACRYSQGDITYKIVNYTIDNDNFDRIKVCDGSGREGVILTRLKKQVQTKEFSFAVDLGTSNTHIEFITDKDTASKPLSYSEDYGLYCTMFSHYLADNEHTNAIEEPEAYLEYDVLPKSLGKECVYSFPTRTVLAYMNGINWNTKLNPFELLNIPFPYNFRLKPDYDDISTNLKWGDEDRQMRSYIDCLALIMRNKVATDGGRLSKTQITWFYPTSMVPNRISNMQDAWKAVYEKYFGKQALVNKMTESVAPIRYFFSHNSTAKNIVNIDIGGGTTDIAFSQNAKVQYATSLRFACNDIFESQLSENTNNGIVNHYKPEFQNILGQMNDTTLITILNRITTPSDVASFLFSLPDNPATDKLDIDAIDFAVKLGKDNNFKIVFVLFYTAIIYHISKILNLKDLPMPRHITFSGNGSKILKIITSDTELLAKFTKTIFMLLTVKGSDGNLEILGLTETNPKEVTCKGALVSGKLSSNTADRNASSLNDETQILVLKTDGSGFISETDTFSKVSEQNYILQATNGVKKFFEFSLNNLNKQFNFKDYFGVSDESLKVARKLAKNEEDIKTFLEKGLSQSKEGFSDNDTIRNTLFFYPIKEILNQLTIEIDKDIN